jgi:hypothetical protein
MFWVRWRQLWMVKRLLWRWHKLNAKEEKFLRDIRADLRHGRELTPRQRDRLEDLYDRNIRER